MNETDDVTQDTEDTDELVRMGKWCLVITFGIGLTFGLACAGLLFR
mgnify:CR=1 FL=1